MAEGDVIRVNGGGDQELAPLLDADIPATIARDSEVTAALSGLSSVYQPLDSDLTAIAALTTTSFGRGLLALADAAALLSAAGAQPSDSDLTAIAALTTTTFGRALLTLADAAATRALLDLEAGTDFPSLSTFNDHDARHESGGGDEMSIAGLAGTPTELTNHLNDTTAAHAASAIGFTPNGSIAATDVQAAIQEVRDEAGGAAADNESAVLHMRTFA